MPLRSSVLITVLFGQTAFAAISTPMEPLDFFSQLTDWSGSSLMSRHGADVAIDGDLAVVGRPGDALDGPQSGAVDVYQRTTTAPSLEGMPWQWDHVCTVRPTTPEAGARFGESVALDDGLLVVGAWRAGNDHGQVWVADLSVSPLPSSIRTAWMLDAPGLEPGDYLGCDVAIDDGLIVAGAWGADIEALQTAGKVWTWSIDASDGSITSADVLISHEAAANARFGSAVDVEDGFVAVGAPRHDGSRGKVDLFEWSGSQWQFVKSLNAGSSAHPWARYGAAVDLVFAVEGVALLVGSPGDDELGAQAGAAWLYAPQSPGSVDYPETTLDNKLTADGGQSWDQAGTSVAGLEIIVDGNTASSRGLILVGAPGWRDLDGVVQGGIMAFSQSDSPDGGHSEGGPDSSWEADDIVSFTDPESALGTSMALDLAFVQGAEWDAHVISIWSGAPKSGNDLGRVFNIDVIADDRNGDCNDDFRFDQMEVLLLGTEVDCDGDGWHDACQLEYLSSVYDCDGNGLIDSCEIVDDPSEDCDLDGTLDRCQQVGFGLDCDNNGLLDVCEISGNPLLDCDGNNNLDACDISNDLALDCDGNGLIDSCEIADSPALDCNDDGVLDVCGFDLVVDQATEFFVGGTDLSDLGGRWLPPSGSPPSWGYCTLAGAGAWIDPTNHTVLSLSDDAAVAYTLPFPFFFAGQSWQQMYIGSNGYVTFDMPDSTYVPSLATHFSMRRISALFADLDPSVSGDVRVGLGPANSVVVTWLDVPLWQQSDRLNRVQLVLHPDGFFETAWELVDVDEAVVGVSVGLGVPPFFNQADLSDAFDCEPQAIGLVPDCNDNGLADPCEADIPGNPRWGVEHFVFDCDLINRQVRWVSQGSSPYWTVCSTNVSDFQINPLGGTDLPLSDEDAVNVPLGFAFPFEGQSYTDVYVYSNGYVTFGSEFIDYCNLPICHYNVPGISVYRTDLDPSSGGQVTAATGPAGSLALTWLDVPVFSGAGAGADMRATMQLVLHPDGAFEITWLEVPVATAIVGPSDGLGLPSGFAQTDLSAAGDECVSVHAWDDCDFSGVHDGIEIALGCLVDLGGGVVESCGYFYEGDADAPVLSCAGDITADQQVDVMDLIAVLHAWGPVKIGDRFARADIAPAKRDRRVGLPDLLAVIDSIGATCP